MPFWPSLPGAVYGIPLFVSQAVNGFDIPADSSDFGLAMAQKLYPVYSLGPGNLNHPYRHPYHNHRKLPAGQENRQNESDRSY